MVGSTASRGRRSESEGKERESRGASLRPQYIVLRFISKFVATFGTVGAKMRPYLFFSVSLFLYTFALRSATFELVWTTPGAR